MNTPEQDKQEEKRMFRYYLLFIFLLLEIAGIVSLIVYEIVSHK